MEIVRHLARYVAAPQPLTDELREAACRATLDLVAAAAAGIGAPGPIAVRQAVPVTMAAGALPIWFTGQSSGLTGTIWANAAAAAALDLDDGHRIARGHPGAAIIPAVFAAAHEAGANTDELLQAIVIGYEVGVAVGAARQFYANTGMWSGYGVVAALGFLRRTSAEHLAQAFAIAGISAPNQLHAGAGPAFRAQEGSDVKEGIPWSSLTAAQSVLLAEAGHSGPLGLLDNHEHFTLDGLVDGLGRQRYITRNYMKFHACCRHVHAPVEALLGLIADNRIDPHRIEAVEVATYSGAMRLANRPHPQGFTDIQFSIPYCLGLAAIDGPDALLPLTAAAVDRPEIVAFANTVSLRLEPELDVCFPAQTLARVTILAEGRNFVSPITAPRGEATDPPSWDVLERKLEQACRFVATAEQSRHLLAALRRLREGDHMPLLQAFATLRLNQA